MQNAILRGNWGSCLIGSLCFISFNCILHNNMCVCMCTYIHMYIIPLSQNKAILKYHLSKSISLTDIYIKKESESEVTQPCQTLCYPMDCSLPGSSIHGIFQARILEWGAISFSRRSSWTKNWIQVFHIVGRCFTVWATREVQPLYPLQ